MSDLIEKAGADNRDFAGAVARVMEAHAQATIQRAALFAQINAQAQALRSPSGLSEPVRCAVLAVSALFIGRMTGRPEIRDMPISELACVFDTKQTGAV